MTLITAKQAGEVLGVSLKTIHRMLSRGDLSRIKVGRSTKVSYEELMAYLRRHGLKEAFA